MGLSVSLSGGDFHHFYSVHINSPVCVTLLVEDELEVKEGLDAKIYVVMHSYCKCGNKRGGAQWVMNGLDMPTGSGPNSAISSRESLTEII